VSMIGNLVAVSPAQLESFVSDPSRVAAFLYPEDGSSKPDNYLDIDKTWHAIHFTLNGDAWGGEGPLAMTLLGGQEIGEDVGYGPAQFLHPWQVKEVAIALAGVDSAEFRERFNPAAMDAAEIYPQMWERDGEKGLEYVLDYYSQLVSFYREAADRGDAVLVYLC
jgi:hypothetical protein